MIGLINGLLQELILLIGNKVKKQQVLSYLENSRPGKSLDNR
jgi:hypothetical protein